ncbi:MAG: alpha/beta fold hydrolase [Deltaproteobacteria bacterium]|nr:alpha/beta fold hydrolase [Deltaproteobacteria bacterium]
MHRPPEGRPPPQAPKERPAVTNAPPRRCPRPQGALAYHLHGAPNTPPTLLIMGYLARATGWRAQVAALAPALSLLTFDHRGVGESEGPSARTMSALADDCVALLDHAGWESAHVVGISMGGMVAQHLALAHPTRVRSLALLATHAGGGLPLPSRAGLPRFLAAQLASTPAARLRALAELLIPLDRLAARPWAEVARQLSEDFSPRPALGVRLGQLVAVLGHDTRARLSELRAPILVVHAGRDLLVPPARQLDLARRLPGAALLSLPEAGHGLLRDDPDALNARLLEHVLSAERAWGGA